MKEDFGRHGSWANTGINSFGDQKHMLLHTTTIVSKQVSLTTKSLLLFCLRFLHLWCMHRIHGCLQVGRPPQA